MPIMSPMHRPSVAPVVVGSRPLRRVPPAIVILTATVILLTAAGCQRIVEVTGTVRLDGKPVKGVIVMFDPAAADGSRGVASTDENGGYKLRRLGPGSKVGVPTGSYSVKVMSDMDNPGAGRIPERYFRSSQLTSEVKAPGPHVFDIDVTTK